MSGKVALLLVVAGVVAGCSTSKQPAPVFERSEPSKRVEQLPPKVEAAAPESSSQIHVVQPGETLYSIAFNYGMDYHELADMNGIEDPTVISVGQRLRVGKGDGRGTGEMPVQPDVSFAAVPQAPPVVSMPLPESSRPRVVAEVKEQPLLMKLAYSEAALEQINKQEALLSPAVVAPTTEVESKPEPANKPEPAATTSDSSGLGWIMPTEGKVIAGFSEADNRKGIDIAGKLGQPVVASAAGKVVYSGNDLRGYGKMVIIKHDNDFISAYAHNDQILVKLGQAVARGQKIALMGDSDADRVKLHFEVRYHGKPVDPAQYLPLGQF